MKNKKPTFSVLVAAALLGIGPIAMADEQGLETFIPLESLSPQERSSLQAQIRELFENSNIDWERLILGVNEKGELVLRERSATPVSPVGQPSCWSDGL